MQLAHGLASRVVLIGGSDGDPERGAVIKSQWSRLTELLADDVRWGLPPENCLGLTDPDSDDEIRRALATAVKAVSRTGLLLVHYVGPVTLDPVRGLLLGVGDGAFQYEEIRWPVRHSRAGRRLVVLDCRGTTVDAERVAQAAILENGVVIVSTGPDPAKGDLTAHLVDLLDRGLAAGPNQLSPMTLHRTFGGKLAMRTGAEPGNFAVVRNPALYQADPVGRVVLAEREVSGPAEARSVILILGYDRDSGTMGVVLNRPGVIRPAEPDWPGAVHEPPVVFAGGPVTHAGHIPLVHLRAGADPPAQFRPIGARLGTLPLTSRPAPGTVARFRLFSGYVGWAPGELEADLATGLITLGEMDHDRVLAAAPEELWHLVRGPVS